MCVWGGGGQAQSSVRHARGRSGGGGGARHAPGEDTGFVEEGWEANLCVPVKNSLRGVVRHLVFQKCKIKIVFFFGVVVVSGTVP